MTPTSTTAHIHRLLGLKKAWDQPLWFNPLLFTPGKRRLKEVMGFAWGHIASCVDDPAPNLYAFPHRLWMREDLDINMSLWTSTYVRGAFYLLLLGLWYQWVLTIPPRVKDKRMIIKKWDTVILKNAQDNEHFNYFVAKRREVCENDTKHKSLKCKFIWHGNIFI